MPALSTPARRYVEASARFKVQLLDSGQV
jgi:hypothetical protein